MPSPQPIGFVSRHLDRIAIGLSAICIVHCIAVPLLVAILPLAAVTFGTDAHWHALLLWLVVPTSVLGFALGYRVHRRAGLVALGLLGLVVVAVAGLWGHDRWSTLAENTVSIAGSLMLAAAHWSNFRDVRRLHRHG